MSDFEIRGATPGLDDGKVTTTTGIGFIDLDELAPQLAPIVTAPNMPMIETDEPTRPATASPTNGPHRYTIVVPNAGGNSENSWLNLGQADPNRINDTGMAGMSKTHIHFHKFADPPTIVALGGPTNHGWSSYKDTPLDSMQGYTMVTLGASYQESTEQTYIVSTEEDVVLRAAKKRILLKADKEDVVIEAAHYVSLGAKKSIKIVGDSGLDLDDPSYKKEIKGKLEHSFDVKSKKKAASITDTVQSIYGVLGSFIKLNGKEPVWGKVEWKPESWLDVVKGLADGAKLYASIGRMVESDGASGKVDIQAETFASMSADNAASIYGTMSASLTSLVSASVLGGTAGLKAATWASVWGGISTSVKAGKDVTVEGEYGKAKLKGRQDVSVSSTKAGVIVQGETNAQLTAGKTAFVVGKEKLVVGGGSGSGTGMVCTQDALKIGMITKVTEAGAADTDDNAIMLNRNSHMKLKWADSSILMESGKTTMISNDLSIYAKSGNLELNGTKILIG